MIRAVTRLTAAPWCGAVAVWAGSFATDATGYSARIVASNVSMVNGILRCCEVEDRGRLNMRLPFDVCASGASLAGVAELRLACWFCASDGVDSPGGTMVGLLSHPAKSQFIEPIVIQSGSGPASPSRTAGSI